MRKYLFFLLQLLILIFLCSCSQDQTAPSLSVTMTPASNYPTDAMLQTSPAETTYPVPLPLGAEAGAYQSAHTDSVTGKTMEYYIYIPESATQNMPLVIFLHGLGEVGPVALIEDNPMISQAKAVYGEAYPFVILAPSTKIPTWASDMIPERLKALIDYIVTEYQIDPERIIITGHSLGSAGVYRMLELYGDYFSAAVPISEPDTSEVDATLCTNVRIWAFAGSEEPECSEQMRQLTQMINDLGGTAQYTEIEDCTHGRTPYRTFLWDVFEWMIQ